MRVSRVATDGEQKNKTTNSKNSMKTTQTHQFTGRDVGLILDCSHDSADTLNKRTISLAEKFGFEVDAEELAEVEASNDEGALSQYLSEVADDAVDYLNGLDLPSYCSFAFEDNCLFLMPCVDNAREDVGFVSGGEDCDPDDSDYPAPDYRGEWLHVNDHGNATLYVRGDDGKDVEIWSVV